MRFDRIDRIGLAVMAALIGGIFGLVVLFPIFIILNIEPMWWFFTTMWLVVPVACWIGWRHGRGISAWLEEEPRR